MSKLSRKQRRKLDKQKRARSRHDSVSRVNSGVVVDEAPLLNTGHSRSAACGLNSRRTASLYSDLSGPTRIPAAGESVLIRARIRSSRTLGKHLCFLKLAGLGTTSDMFTIQAVCVRAAALPTQDIRFISSLPLESIVDVAGTMEATTQNNPDFTIRTVEIRVASLYLVSASASLPFRVEGPRVSLTLQLQHRAVSLRHTRSNTIFRAKSRAGCDFLQFLMKQCGFLEVHTPLLDQWRPKDICYQQRFQLDYFGKAASLRRQATVYHQLLMSADLGRVAEIHPAFHKCSATTRLHLCQFTLMSFEMEIMEHYHEMLELLISLLQFIFDGVAHANVVWTESEPLLYQRIPVFSYEEVLPLLEEEDDDENPFPPHFYDGGLTHTDLRRLAAVIKRTHDSDVFIIDRWPVDISCDTSMPSVSGNSANEFKVVVRGISVARGAQHIHDAVMLSELGEIKDHPENAVLVRALAAGCPPHAGVEIGLERLVMAIFDLSNIREASLFPRDSKGLLN